MKSTFKVSFFLKRNQVNKDGNAPIIARITVDGRIAEFSTKMNIHPGKWSVEKGKASGHAAPAANLNTTLETIKASLYKHYLRLQERNEHLTAEKIKNVFLGQDKSKQTILYFFEQHNNLYRQRIGKTTTHVTYSRYELVKRRLTEFMKEVYSVSDIIVQEIDLNFIERFEDFIRDKHKCSNNTAKKFVQRLRTIVNFAKNTGLNFIDPFANYKMRLEKIDRGYLTEEEIHTLLEKKFAIKRLEQIRDIFIFSCFTGLSYIDLKNLTSKNICTSFDKKAWIKTKRHKTGTDVNVPLLEIPAMILEKYANQIPDNALLPVPSNQKINAYLKEIGEVCGIEKELTFHLARHTFATLLLTKGVPIESVSKMLGHTNITTTQIYARITNTKISHDMQEFAEKVKGIEKVYQI